jgi:hypothetical protein
MSEQDKMDQMLRQSMARVPMPDLSSDFNKHLQRRLHPQRLSQGRRLILVLYTVISLLTSFWFMRLESIDWLIGMIAVATPITIVCAVSYRRILSHFFSS